MSRVTVMLLLVCAAVVGCATPEHIVLLKGEDGTVGELAVQKDGQTVVLDEAYAVADVGGSGNLNKSTTDESSIQSQFGDAIAARPKKPASFTLYFKEGTTGLMPESKPDLARMFAEVKERQAPDVQVTGHTDRVGTVKDNDALGNARAGAVRALLIDLGLQPQMVSAVSRGEREPLLPTDDEVDEPRNRRVEVTVR